MAILEAHLAKSLVDEGRLPVDDAVVRRRITEAIEANKGQHLPGAYVEDVFEMVFNVTLEFAKASIAAPPKFTCKVTPGCNSGAGKKSISSLQLLSLFFVIISVAGRR